MKKLSIAIPTYKRNNELSRCLNSIEYVEEYADFIEIVISDNDPSNTFKKFNNDKFYDVVFNRNNENLGIMGNMKKIIELSNGEFIFFITDDDYFLPGAVSSIFKYVKNIKPEINAFKIGLITHLIKSKKVWENNYNITESLSNEDKQKNIFESSHIFSGSCIKKEKIPFEDFNKTYNKFYYTTSLLFGYNFNNLDYLDELLIMHTWQNEVHWDFANPESPELDENWNDMCDHLKHYTNNKSFNELKQEIYSPKKNDTKNNIILNSINYFLKKINLEIISKK